MSSKVFVFVAILMLADLASAVITLSEVYYDTPGNDNVEEWFELHSSDAVYLTGYNVSDNSGIYAFPEGTSILAGGYIVVARNASGFHALFGFNPDLEGMKLSLGNSGDELTLKDSSGNVLDYVAWENYTPGWSVKAEVGYSIQRDGSLWVGDAVPTPSAGYSGAATSTTQSTSTTGTTTTTIPAATSTTLVLGSTTTTILPDPTSTTILLNFSTTTTLSDSTTTSLPATTTTLRSNSTTTTLIPITSTTSSSTTQTTSTLIYPKNILLTEVFYDTPGTDSIEEWVELLNNGSDSVNLRGYALDNDKGSYVLPSYTLGGGKIAVIAKNEAGFQDLYGFTPDVSGLTLSMNNNGGALTLKTPAGEAVDSVAWEGYMPYWNLEAKTGESLQRSPLTRDTDSESDWVVSDDPTPASSEISPKAKEAEKEAKTTTTTLKKTTTTTIKSTTTTLKKQPTTTLIKPLPTTTLKKTTTTTMKRSANPEQPKDEENIEEIPPQPASQEDTTTTLKQQPSGQANLLTGYATSTMVLGGTAIISTASLLFGVLFLATGKLKFNK